jgi:Signal transduction histidine kinase
MVHGYDMSYFDKTDTDNLNSLGKILGVALGEIEISRLMLSQNRQEQISQLASGLAHEVRNPLAVISIGLELLARKLDMNDEIVQKAFSNIENSVERANSIVENLMRLAVPDDQETALSRVNLHSVLSEAIALVSFHVRQKDIKLNLKSSQTLYVLGNKEGLLKVFVNLCLNAIQALDRGGRIEIMTQETESEEISIAIKDNGPGIPEQDLGRVLKPFFSTKKDNHGSGMGLYICTEIIQRFQGSLIISNNPDAGVMVQIILKQG